MAMKVDLKGGGDAQIRLLAPKKGDPLNANFYLLGIAVLAGAAAFHLIAALYLQKNNGLWGDELFSLEASNPDMQFMDVFFNYILPDTNPPLYFSALYFVRKVVPDDIAAIFVTNYLFVMLACSLIALLSASRRRFLIGACCISFLLLCGPTLTFASEGRAYCAAIMMAGALAFVVGSALTLYSERRELIVAVVFAFLGTLLHIYGALFAGAVGVGCYVAGRMRGRADLRLLGSVVTTTAVMTFSLWMLFAFPQFTRAAHGGFWIAFSFGQLIHSELAGVRHLGLGAGVGNVLLMLLVLFFLLRGSIRAVLLATGISAFLFIFLPIAISLHTPMVTARYLMIGVPAFLILILFCVTDYVSNPPGDFIRTATIITASVLGLVLLGTSFPFARQALSQKLVWRGADVAREGLLGCASPTLRVNEFLPGYVRLLHLGEIHFIAAPVYAGGYTNFVNAENSPPADVADAPCRTIGWAEHVVPPVTTMEEALIKLRLTNTHAIPLEFFPFRSGFVIRKKR